MYAVCNLVHVQQWSLTISSIKECSITTNVMQEKQHLVMVLPSNAFAMYLQAVEKLQAQLHFLGVPASNKHTVFVDSEADVQSFSPESYFDTPKELLDRRFNRPRNAQLKSPAFVPSAEAATEIVKESEKCAGRYL